MRQSPFAGLLLLAACSGQEGGSTSATSSLRQPYSLVLTLEDCALHTSALQQPEVQRQLSLLQQLRASARQRGLGGSLEQLEQSWQEAMATADTACPDQADGRLLAQAIAELAAAIDREGGR